MRKWAARIILRALLVCVLIGPRVLPATETPAATDSAQFHNAQALAEARIGRWSRSLAELRIAERLAPGDPILRENLRLVRTKIGVSTPINLLHALAVVPMNVWAGMTQLAFWLAGAIWGLRRWRASWRKALDLPQWLSILGCIGTAALLGLALLGRRLTPDAVVIAKDAILRQGPVDAAKPIGTIADGSEVQIRREHFGWYEVGPVRLGTPALGWLPPGHLVLVGR